MLTELVIQNLVIVERAILTPGSGLTVITGETGSGKSLLLDALDLILGGRSQAGLIGPFADAATIIGVFQVEPMIEKTLIEACGVPCVDGQFILKRRLSAGGRSQAWINDEPVTVSMLRIASEHLVEIHAQHASLRLADQAVQLDMLDSFGGLIDLASAYRELHATVLEIDRQLTKIDNGSQESLRELDFLHFQMREIDALAPRRGELAELEARYRVLNSADEWRQMAIQGADQLIDGERCVAQIIGRLAKRLAEAPSTLLTEAGRNCFQAFDLVREAGRACLNAVDELHADPADLQRIEERINAWHDLIRKHGEGEEALFTAWQNIAARIAELSDLKNRRAELIASAAEARKNREMKGWQLAKARAQIFPRFADAIHEQLTALGLPRARLHLHEHPSSQPAQHGLTHQEFHLSTNPGLPSGRLGDVSSGGEVSRLALAMAGVIPKQRRASVLIFDEIDSGVGGRLGAAIGARLKELASGRTLIAITHTAQLAAVAERHYVVRKQQSDRSTSVIIEELSADARLQELAAMMGGGPAALNQAEVLLAGSHP